MSSSTMDKYQRVNVIGPKTINPNECRITNKGLMKSYLSFIVNRLTGTVKSGEEQVADEQDVASSQVVLQGMGRTISKVVSLAEIVKRRIPKLHQVTSIKSVDLEDVYMPLEEGLEKVIIKRQVASISITLSTTAPSDDVIAAAGYQPPSDVSPSDIIQITDEKKKAKRQNRRGNKGVPPALTSPEGDGIVVSQDIAAENNPSASPEDSITLGPDTTANPRASRSSRGRRGGGRFRSGRRIRTSAHKQGQQQQETVDKAPVMPTQQQDTAEQAKTSKTDPTSSS